MDVVIAIGLFLVGFLSITGVLRASLTLSTIARSNVVATELANSQIEYMRGFAYDALGTVNGIPSGNIPQATTTTLGGVTYTTRTLIEYIDSPADGLGVSDSNHITTDYKVGKATVSYTIQGKTYSVSNISNFVPPTIESSTGGGTLSIHVVDSQGGNLPDAQVQIINASTSPVINLTIDSNDDGLVVLGGAPTSTQYQIAVTRTNYSSAQTYARTSQNINPTPGHLTVSKDLITNGTFAIDRLSTFLLTTITLPSVNTFTDTFANYSNVISHSNTVVDDEKIKLSTDQFSGSLRSIPISPSGLLGWGLMNATLSVPSNTNVLVHVTDGAGSLIPDQMLPGNAAGYTSFPVVLSSIATSSYPSLSLSVDLTRVATSSNPSLSQWSLSYSMGLIPSPSVAYTLAGAKSIGTDSNNRPIYKTVVTGTTDTNGVSSKMIEWDAYILTLNTTTSPLGCPLSPLPIPAGTTYGAVLQIGVPTANTLPVAVVTQADVHVENALVRLSNTNYTAAIPTDACGMVLFNGLSSGTYSLTASAPGFATTTINNVSVSGHTATTTITFP